jgi:hypothetical protein
MQPVETGNATENKMEVNSMELRGYCSAIQNIEDMLGYLVEMNRAEQISDSSKYFNLPFLAEKTKSDDFVRKYQIRLPQSGLMSPSRVNIRFWYKLSANKASIKITQQGVELLLANLSHIMDGKGAELMEKVKELEIVPEIQM